MNYIVLDLEWNQALRRESIIREPVPLHGEIIQIGAVKLDEKFNIKDSFKIIIKPKYYRILHKHIQKLTGITQYQLERGADFSDAIKQFRRFCGRHCVWMIWGTDDIAIFRDNLIINGVGTEWLPKYYNLVVMFNDQVSGETRQWALEDAMTAMMIESDLSAHDALNDAQNTAKIAQKLDIRAGMAAYEENSVRMQYSVAHAQTTHFTGFESAELALSDRDCLRCVCPICAKKLPAGKWTGNIYTRMVSVIVCPIHGSFKVSVQAKREDDGSWSVTKNVKSADRETIEKYEEKVKRARKRRRRGSGANKKDTEE